MSSASTRPRLQGCHADVLARKFTLRTAWKGPRRAESRSYSTGAFRRRAVTRKQVLCRSAAVEAPPEISAVSPAAKHRKYVMVSGKGGVGKTSLSAALAVKYAAAGHDTLIVSTDPAHSLGDSLGQLLPGGAPVPVEGTELPIWGMEIDPDKVTEDFKAFASTGGKEKVQGVLDKFGMGQLMEQLSELGLDELLSTPPPGLDEAIAIAKVVEFVEGASYARFTRIIFDTAPTGHTLRMLSLPDFVSSALVKVRTLQGKLAGSNRVVSALFGEGGSEKAVARLQALQARVDMVAALFRDQENMDFVIATIPTTMALEESARLLASLRKEGVPASTIVVNQVITPGMGAPYLRMKLAEQRKALELLQASPRLQALQVVRGQYTDVEVTGVPALQYFAGDLWRGMPAPAAAAGEGLVRKEDRRFYLLGGKGGVGKTTASAALAVHLATQNVPTLVVSTDPAHSLSDSFGQDVSGGAPVALAGTELPLWGMEIEPEEAREELRGLAREDGGNEAFDMLKNVGLGSVAEQLKDLNLGELLDNPPPGIDEAVAISRVVRFLRSPDYAQFRCVVFDTAPTGHTLRLLSLPDFFDTGIGKLVRLRFTIANTLGKVTSFFNRDKGKGAAVDGAMARLRELQGALDEARAMFHDKERTEFVVVTIPTVMAMAESDRLVKALHEQEVPCKRIVVNQLVNEEATEKFLNSRRHDQQRALHRLRSDEQFKCLQVIEAPLLDLEVRGVPALQYFGSQVWHGDVLAPHEDSGGSAAASSSAVNGAHDENGRGA